MLKFVFAVFGGGLFVACAPTLGDGCTTNVDCSVNGDRFCDRAQPGGYCTIANCEPGSCGEEGICVRFKPDEPRLSSTWCMAKCDQTGDCDRDRYVCRNSAELNNPENPDEPPPEGTPRVAEVLEGKANRSFCVVRQ